MDTQIVASRGHGKYEGYLYSDKSEIKSNVSKHKSNKHGIHHHHHRMGHV